VGATACPPALTGEKSAALEDYLRAIDDLVDLLGAEHVGLGPDFREELPRPVASAAPGAPDAEPVRGFESISAADSVTRGLLERGYTPEDVKKIIGGNWLRLYQQIWKPAFAPREGVKIEIRPGFGRRRTDWPRPAGA